MQVKLYGRWTAEGAPEHSAHGELLIRFMDGDPTLEPTTELLDMLRSEFVAIDTYREGLERRINYVAASMSRCASELVPKLEVSSGPHEQYEAGFSAGAYLAYAGDAQALRSALLECQAEAAK